MTNEEMQQQLELQLHEQYAVNNNSNLGSMIALIVGMLGVIGGFGYIYVNSSCEPGYESVNVGFGMKLSSGIYSLDALIMSFIVAVITIYIMMLVCMELGMKQRLEQFITHAIRMKYYDGELNRKIYPENYDPFNKIDIDKISCCRIKGIMLCCKYDKKDKLASIQGLYGTLIKTFNCLFILITLAMVAKIIVHCLSYHEYRYNLYVIIETTLAIFICLFGFLRLHCRYKKLKEKYNERNKYYKDILKIKYIKN